MPTRFKHLTTDMNHWHLRPTEIAVAREQQPGGSAPSRIRDFEVYNSVSNLRVPLGDVQGGGGSKTINNQHNGWIRVYQIARRAVNKDIKSGEAAAEDQALEGEQVEEDEEDEEEVAVEARETALDDETLVLVGNAEVELKVSVETR